MPVEGVGLHVVAPVVVWHFRRLPVQPPLGCQDASDRAPVDLLGVAGMLWRGRAQRREDAFGYDERGTYHYRWLGRELALAVEFGETALQACGECVGSLPGAERLHPRLLAGRDLL